MGHRPPRCRDQFVRGIICVAIKAEPPHTIKRTGGACRRSKRRESNPNASDSKALFNMVVIDILIILDMSGYNTNYRAGGRLILFPARGVYAVFVGKGLSCRGLYRGWAGAPSVLPPPLRALRVLLFDPLSRGG